VDTEAEQDLAMAFGINSIPTIVAIRDSVIVYQQPGSMPEAMLETLIGKVRELDMEKVRAEAA
jgi:thioredoxin 1